MPFERVWDESCPRVWDQWEADGITYTIQDLPPEDDEEAVRIMLEHFAPDEVIFKASNIVSDPISMRVIGELWRSNLSRRTSLACYAEKDENRRMVALNVCMVEEKGENKEHPTEGKKLYNALEAFKYTYGKANPLEYLGLDQALSEMGLVVLREYRGAKLGAKVLAAREPMCRAIGIQGTMTIFTGIASQKLAARCGFHSIFEIPIKGYAQIGLDYPEDDERLIKVMVKKYE